MVKLNNKKVLVIIMIIAVCFITYLIYTKQDNEIEFLEDNFINEEQENSNLVSKEEKNTIVIYITGEVVNQGIYEMEYNSRISDAIEKAGGLTEKANIKDINLASLLEDEMKIYIPNIEEAGKVENVVEENPITSKREEKTKSKININTATQSDLETLPGIGEATALKIINYRKEKGKFFKIEDIKNVSGIGESKFSKIKDMITV